MGYISFEHVCKYYQTGDTVVKAVDDVNFTIEKGEFCVVLGPSGAGKTTILNLLGGMDKATSGTITVGGKQITGLRSPQLTDYHVEDFGPYDNSRFGLAFSAVGEDTRKDDFFEHVE